MNTSSQNSSSPAPSTGRFNKRTKRTIVVLLIFVLLACISSYLYHSRADQLNRDTLHERLSEYETGQ